MRVAKWRRMRIGGRQARDILILMVEGSDKSAHVVRDKMKIRSDPTSNFNKRSPFLEVHSLLTISIPGGSRKTQMSGERQ